MSLIVRPWTEHDLPAVREVLRRTWEYSYAPFIPLNDLRLYLDEHYSLEALHRLIANPEITGFVGVRGDQPVAMMRTRNVLTESRTYVSSLYVVPEEQGQGWGRALMNVAAQQAVSDGRKEVWLGVMNKNLQGLEWYRKHGFVAVREEPFKMGGTSILHLIGCLPVSAFLSAGEGAGAPPHLPGAQR
jgi:ribosomal protein S18 acetylase RimI-like enzyme